MRQLTLTAGLRLCKVRNDGGVVALLNSLDSEEDLCTVGSFCVQHQCPSVLFSCDDAEWHHTEERGRTDGAMFTTNVHYGGRHRDHIRSV